MITMSEGRLPRLTRGASLAKMMIAALLTLSFVALMAGSANAAPKYSLSIKNSEGGSSPLFNSVGVGNDSAGNVYIISGTQIEKYNSSGKYLTKMGAGKVTKPVDVDVDPSGNVWVADYTSERLAEFNSAGTFLRYALPLEKPTSVATDAAGNVWALGAEMAYEFDSSGKLINLLGQNGLGFGSFGGAVAMDIDTSGQIWITVSASKKVYHYSAAGTLLSSWTAPSIPAGVAGDGSGSVWVALPSLCRVEKFSSAGVGSEKFGEKCGVGLGKLLNMPNSSGLTLAPAGALWVSNTNEIQKWIP
jgi:streptogramin lyase